MENSQSSKTQEGSTKSNIYVGGERQINCECGEKQTSSHMFECTLLPIRCEMKDFIGLTEITDKTIEITE